jgi:hypothetical protein
MPRALSAGDVTLKLTRLRSGAGSILLVLLMSVARCAADNQASASANSVDTFVPSFERDVDWVAINGDSFAWGASSIGNTYFGTLSVTHTDQEAGTPFSGSPGVYSGSNLDFLENGELTYHGHFTNPDTIALTRADGVRYTVAAIPRKTN